MVILSGASAGSGSLIPDRCVEFQRARPQQLALLLCFLLILMPFSIRMLKLSEQNQCVIFPVGLPGPLVEETLCDDAMRLLKNDYEEIPGKVILTLEYSHPVEKLTPERSTIENMAEKHTTGANLSVDTEYPA